MSERLEMMLSYKRLFSTRDGTIVLKDLARAMRGDCDLYTERSGDSANDVIFRAGRLSILNHIDRMMNDERIEKLQQEKK